MAIRVVDKSQQEIEAEAGKKPVRKIILRKAGRPVKVGKPWIEAGVSRATWYRRQKERGE